MGNKKPAIKKRYEDISAILILVVACILLIWSGTRAYFNIKEQEKKVNDLAKEKQITTDKQKELENTTGKALDLSSRVGWLSKDEKKITSSNAWNSYDSLKDFLNRMVAYLSANYQITDYKPWDPDDETTKKNLTLQELIDIFERITQKNIEKNKDLINARNSSWEQIVKIVGTKDERGELAKNIDQKNQEIIKVRGDIAALEKDVQRIIAQGENDVLMLQEGIKQIDVSTTEKTKEGEMKLAELNSKKKEYEERLEKLRNRMELTSEGIEIDGKIILADTNNNSVCVDLGSKDAIVKGMDFEVFTILKGGLKKSKGRVKIIKVFDDYSQAAIITDTIKSNNEITIEDLVNSDIYNRQRAKTFIFAGTPIGEYLKEDLKKKIEEFGGRVLSTLNDDITYVIAGKNFENDDNYKKAIYLGAIVLREKELYDLLHIEWKD